nr:transposase [Sodaliphilus pleomorphus]
MRPPKFGEADMYRALSLLSGHIDDIQAGVYACSARFMERRDRVIYYDCTNYYFEIEDNDRDTVDIETGELVAGLRKRGKSKENRPSPIVQMGMFMDMDGIPLAFVVFPGNESEQATLQPLEDVLRRKFGLTEFVVSTDAGLASEGNRRYNMDQGRDYICVQSIPSLPAADRRAAVDPRGWRLGYCADGEKARLLREKYSDGGLYNLDVLREGGQADSSLLRQTTFYKEILVDKTVKCLNPQWLEARRENPGATPVDARGRRIRQWQSSSRAERVIVTYSHDFALFLRHKRAERLAAARKIVARGQANPRRSQQSPLNYIETIHKTDDGQTAVKTEMVINDDILGQEEKLDGFYAYATSLDDEAALVLKARSFHHEIEHLFRTTKTHLEARPVYLSRQDRIRSHFLVCFLALLLLKLLQKQLADSFPEAYKEHPLTVDQLIDTLQNLRFGQIQGLGYVPMFQRTSLTDQLQELAGVEVNKQIITKAAMNAFYRKVNKG